jgi:hypothetical protein
VKPDLPTLCQMPRPAVVPDSYSGRLHWIYLLQRYEKIHFRDNGRFDGFVVPPTPQGSDTIHVVSYLEECSQSVDTLKRLAPGLQTSAKVRGNRSLAEATC